MTVTANGVELYYEKTGSGEPLLLLHGNGESCKIFRELSGLLAPRFTVYALDTRSHGKSGRGALSYTAMAEDVSAFISALNLKKPALYGFSDGGITGLILAAKYPDTLSRLIVSGANLNPEGLTRGFYRLLKFLYFFSRSEKTALMLNQPDIKAGELELITASVLVLAGEKDIIKTEHTESIARAIKNSRLQIVKGENHQSYVLNNKKLYGIIIPFLTGGQ